MSLETIAVRVYTVPKSAKKGQTRPYFGYKKLFFDRTLVYDCETTNDYYQNIRFGYFEIHQHNILEESGLFYDAKILKQKELELLLKYCNENSVKLYTEEEFRRIFLHEAYDLETLCIGFNLAYDLTRIAINSGIARSGKKDCFSLLFSSNLHYPRLQITHVSSTLSFIQWGSTKNKSKNFKGNFLDLRTFCNALTDTKHSLESACKAFKSQYQKTKSKHNKIDSNYIKYCINDVKSTLSLYHNAKTEYDTYQLDLPITRAYTPATIAKSILHQIGVKPFLEKNKKFPKDILGYSSSSYFGARTECKIRKTPEQVDGLDFRAMYPTVSILQNLWRYVIADKIEHQVATSEIITFVDSIKLEDIQNPETWTKMQAIVLVEPDGDVLPVRSKFGQKYSWNIGVCEITSKTALWYTLADVIFSKLSAGKTPKILKAFKFYPVGIQSGLVPIEIHGIKIDPKSQDLFKELVEYRQKLKDTRDSFTKDNPQYDYYDRLQNVIKIITNAISYGIFFEIVTDTETKPVPVDVYGLTHFSQKKRQVEQPKHFFNPIVATFITSASRLLLGASEIILQKHGTTHAYCDTDSMFVPPKYTNELQNFFQPLNPYSFDLPLFKLERSKWFYGISTKRYCLFEFGKDRQIIIDDEKFSGHGLGHLLNPFGDSDQDWYRQIWQDIIKLHYGKMSWDEFYQKYENKYPIQQLVISSPEVLKRISKFNEGKDYHNQIKPCNFSLLGFSNRVNEETNEPIKPFAPYCEPAKHAVFSDFVDYNTKNGKKICGKEYWKPFSDVVLEYLREPESKLEGNERVLQRKKIVVENVIHIGKESNNLDDTQTFGLGSDSYVIYENNSELERKFKDLVSRILELKPKDVKKFGISRQTLWNVKSKIEAELLHRISNKIKIRLMELLVN